MYRSTQHFDIQTSIKSLSSHYDGPVFGPGSETDRPTPILKGLKPTEDRIITDRAITSDG